MAKPLDPDTLLRALRNEGVKVIEWRNWRTHHRPSSTGRFGPVYGVMVHHTVTRGDTHAQTIASVELCYNGHSKLPGPLCHGVIAKDGTVYLVSAGRANHAGKGDGDVLARVVDEAAMLPIPKRTDTDGNVRFYGFEAINLGDGRDPWPEAQLLAIERASAAICRVHGWTERSVIGHKEWQPGKVDPRGFTMATMRGRIKARLAPSRPAPEKNASNAMALTADDKTWIIEAIKNQTSLVLLRTDGQYLAPTDAADWDPNPNNMGHWWSGTTVFDSLVTATRANRRKLDAIIAHLGMDPVE